MHVRKFRRRVLIRHFLIKTFLGRVSVLFLPPYVNSVLFAVTTAVMDMDGPIHQRSNGANGQYGEIGEVGPFSICGPRRSFRARPRPRKRDEEVETTARSPGYFFVNSQFQINTNNSPLSGSLVYSEIAC